MSLSIEQLSQVHRALGQSTLQRADLAQHLRASFPGISFAVCDDNDIPSRIKPVAEGTGFALYGIAGGEHCASLTTNLDAAGGLAIALRDEDD